MAINLNELQDLLNQAQTTAVNEKEIRKSLTRVENLMGNIAAEVAHVYSLLDGAVSAKKERKVRAPKVAAEADPEAPFGRKADGTPKKRPGRKADSEA
jgi:hypothetical protein